MKQTLLAVLPLAISLLCFGEISFADNPAESRYLNELLRLARRNKAIDQELARLEKVDSFQNLNKTQKIPYSQHPKTRAQVIDMALDTLENKNQSANSANEQTAETVPSAKRVFNAKEGWDLTHQIPDQDDNEKSGFLLESVLPEESLKKEVHKKGPVPSLVDWPGRWKSDWGLKTGYRQDYLRWNIAGDIHGHDPNILSELTWDDLHILQLQADGEVVGNDFWRLEGVVGFGEILSGKNQDSDYLANNRSQESSRSNNDTNDDDVLDLSLGGGIQFYLKSSKDMEELLETDRLGVGLLGGYSYHQQNLRITDGFQTIPATGPFGGLNSTYQAEWDGPWLGVELFGKRDRFTGRARFQYHWVDYYAEADWNLRTDFQHPKSFEHEAEDGKGRTFILDAGYVLNDQWSLHLEGDLRFFSMGTGFDRTFFSSGTVSTTRLNEVKWISYAFLFSATYQFPK